MEFDIRRAFVMTVAVSALWVATSAASCSEDLQKASEGLNAITAKCSELADPAKAAAFDRASAEAANRSDQAVSQTIKDAAASRRRHCANSANPSYEPYSDVQMDLIK